MTNDTQTLTDKIGNFDKGCIDWWYLYSEEPKDWKISDEDLIKVKDVRDAIKKLKDEMMCHHAYYGDKQMLLTDDFEEIIDAIFGSELSK